MLTAHKHTEREQQREHQGGREGEFECEFIFEFVMIVEKCINHTAAAEKWTVIVFVLISAHIVFPILIVMHSGKVGALLHN